MSCGTRLQGRFYSWHEREEIAEKLEADGEYRLAEKVKREECLDYSELYNAQQSLERQGMERYHDYKEERCHCSTDDEQY